MDGKQKKHVADKTASAGRGGGTSGRVMVFCPSGWV